MEPNEQDEAVLRAEREPSLGDVSFQQVGRYLLTEIQRSPEQQEELLRRLGERFPEIEQSIRTTNNRIIDLLSRYDSLDVVVHLAIDGWQLVNAPIESIYSPKVEPLGVEHLALLALKRPRTKAPPLCDPREIEELKKMLIGLRSDLVWLGIAKEAKRTKPESIFSQRIEDLCFRVRYHELLIRGNAYPWVHRAVVESLFSPFAGDIESQFGFSAVDALRVAEAFPECMIQKLVRRTDAARAHEGALREMLRVAGQKEDVKNQSDEFKQLAKQMEGLSPFERNLALKQLTQSWIFFWPAQRRMNRHCERSPS